MVGLPTGTVTFLFTDIEGSTKLAQEHRDRWEAVRARHHAILNGAMEANEGHVFQIIGDAFCVAFHTASGALNAALEAQRKLQSEDWGETPIKVRMGINTGTAQAGGSTDLTGGYTGFSAMARTQRVMTTAYGGQILVSNTTSGLLLDEMPEGVSLRDMDRHRLKGLLNLEHLWQVVAPGLEQDFPALQTLNSIPNNLPIQLTSFIGREKEVAEIKNLIGHNRLVTLTGSGGVGKTRHSLQVSAELLDTFADGTWLIEMAPIADPRLVPQAVATVLGVREDQGRSLTTALEDHLRNRTVFLVLDSCEHLLDACARLADSLLHTCPRLKILASSREALGLSGEVAYRVPSLAMPDPRHLPPLENLTQYDAVRLFIERALAVKSDFAVTNENAPAVAQICSRLDGIPLAIELAAARVKGLSVEQIAHHLDDRFRLLTGGSRTALPRHQTLRAMIEWSYDLLSDPERTLLRRLGVFVGDWTLEAAENVCAHPKPGSSAKSAARPRPDRRNLKRAGNETTAAVPAVIEILLRLVDKSLVVEEERGAQARYHMLETIHQFARDKLWESGEGPALRDHHLAFFLDFSEQAETRLHTTEHMIWLNQLGAEYENLQAALEWARQAASHQPAPRLARAMEQLGDVKALIGLGTQAIARYRDALEISQSAETGDRMIAARLHSKVLLRVADLKWHLDADQYDALVKVAAASNASLVASLEQLKDAPPSLEQARLLTTLAFHAADISVPPDPGLAETYARAALDLAEKLDSPVEISTALGALGDAYFWRGQLRERLEVQKRRVLIGRTPGFGDPREQIVALLEAGNAHMQVGEYAEALPILQEAEGLGRHIQAIDLEKTALDQTIQTLLRLDRWDEALALDGTMRQMVQRYPVEQIGLSCFEIGQIASIHALRGQMDLAVKGREEANAIMTANTGAFERWDRVQHY